MNPLNLPDTYTYAPNDHVVVIGAGVSGLVTSWILSKRYRVTLIDAEKRLGGHVNTVTVKEGDREIPIDTGFIVCNELNYPLFLTMLAALGVKTQPSTMSFSVTDELTGIEYSGSSLSGLFAQRKNFFRADHFQMIREILRFFREAPEVLSSSVTDTLGEYLTRQKYSYLFKKRFILPMGGAIWSTAPLQVLDYPVIPFVQFFHQHRMLQINNRPVWRVVAGGSHTYVHALQRNFSGTTITGDAAVRIDRSDQNVTVTLQSGHSITAEAVVCACHADQSLTLFSEPTLQEREILGGIQFQPNDMTLHTDTSVLPKNHRARAAWNVRQSSRDQHAITVTYDMNVLQSLQTAERYCVSLNSDDQIDERRVLARERFFHPVYSSSTFQSQSRKAEIQGKNRTFFAGAYWGFGFHEDGMRSAVEVASMFGVTWPEVRP